MADGVFGNDIFTGSAELNPEAVLTDPALQNLFARSGDLKKRRALQNRVENFEDIIRAAGEEVPVESGPGFLAKAADFLDTPGQLVRGAVAKGANVTGFENLNFAQAARKAAEDNLISSDILRDKGLFISGADASTAQKAATGIARGAAGFALDVLLDPLTYLTLGGGAGVRAGGKALSNAPVVLKSGKAAKALDIFADLKKKKFDELITPEIKKFETGIASKEFLDLAKIQISQTATKFADDVFKSAAQNVKNLKRAKSSGEISLLKEAGEEVPVLKAREVIAKQLDLGENVSLEDLFAKPAIRVSNDIRIFGDGFARMFGIDEIGNIPGVTNASAKAFELIGGPLYNANVKVGRVAGTILDQAEKIPFFGNITKAGRSIPAGFSRRIASGGKTIDTNIREFEAANRAVAAEVAELSDSLFKMSDGSIMDLSLRDEIVDVMEAGIRQPIKVGARPGARIEDPAIFEKALKKLTARYADDPDKARDIERITRGVRQDWVNYFEEASSRGILESSVDAYLPHMYANVVGLDEKAAFKAARDAFRNADPGGLPSYTFERKLATLSEARARGLRPVTDLKEIWEARTIAHRRSVAMQDFAERLFLDAGLPNATKQKMIDLVGNHANQNFRLARNLLRERGVRLTQQEALQAIGLPEAERIALAGRKLDDAFSPGNPALDPVTGIIRTPEGVALDPGLYQQLKREVRDPDRINDVGRKANEELAQKMGLKFTKAEEETLTQLYQNYEKTRQVVPGRFGELVTTRAGSRPLPRRMANLINRVANSGKLDPDVAAFYGGTLPEPLVHMLEDSFDTRTLVQQFIDNASPTDPMRDTMAQLASGYVGWLNWLKKGATLFFPAYHARNLGSGQMQMTKVAPILGTSIAPIRMIKVQKMLRKIDKGEAVHFTTEAGERITGQQLKAEMRRFGMNLTADDALDISKGLSSTVKAMSLDPAKISTAGKIFNKAETSVKSIFRQIERHGRANLYMHLRQKGYNAASAADLATRTMIDYARGKTKTERLLANNLIFFYSFARGEATNTVTSLLTRPGGITSQIHAVDGLAEMLRDPNAAPLPPDIEGQIETIRTQQNLSRFIGYSPEGVPRVMSQAGIPFEDLSRFINFKAPQKLTPGAIFEAAGQSVQATMKTLFASVNPILRRPIEIAMNKSVFFDRPLDDKTIRRIPQFAKAFRDLSVYDPNSIPDRVVEGLDAGMRNLLIARPGKNGTWIGNPHAIAALSFFPALDRIMSTSAFMTKDGVSGKEKLLRVASGVKTLDVDLQKSVLFDRASQLQDFMKSRGIPSSKAGAKKLRREIDANQSR